MRRRIIVPASEVRAVFIECRSCGLQLVPGTNQNGQVFHGRCPQCGEPWTGSTSAQVTPAVNDLLTAVRKLRKSGVEVFVEIDESGGQGKVDA